MKYFVCKAGIIHSYVYRCKLAVLLAGMEQERHRRTPMLLANSYSKPMAMLKVSRVLCRIDRSESMALRAWLYNGARNAGTCENLRTATVTVD